MSIVKNLRELVKSKEDQTPISRKKPKSRNPKGSLSIEESKPLSPNKLPLTEADEDEQPGGFGGFDIDSDADNADMEDEDFQLGYEEEESVSDVDEIDDGHASFEETYPEVSSEEAIYTTYNEWLSLAKSKQFYKTIAYYYGEYKKGNLNFISRDFLWKFAKSVSSAITHLFIEAEQKAEAIILVETYYDSLVDCMNSIVYARDAEDIQTIFLYMVDFLAMDSETDEEPSEEQGESGRDMF